MRNLVNETLKQLEPEIKYSIDAENLVLGTGAHESLGWKYRKQISGPALGYWQIEPNTFYDIVTNFLAFRKPLASKIKQICGISVFKSEDLINNDKLSICFCRVAYFRCKEQIPTDLTGYAKMYKLRYNTINGKGTEQEFIQHYKMFVK